jgi:hypothetical protein
LRRLRGNYRDDLGRRFNMLVRLSDMGSYDGGLLRYGLRCIFDLWLIALRLSLGLRLGLEGTSNG